MAHHKHPHGHTPAIDEHADSWHHHDPSSEGVPQPEHGGIASPGTITKWYLALVGTVAFSILGISMYYGSYLEPLKKERFEREGWAGMSAESQEYKSASRAELDKAAPLPEGKYRLPIDVAMDKVVEAYGGKKAQ